MRIWAWSGPQGGPVVEPVLNPARWFASTTEAAPSLVGRIIAEDAMINIDAPSPGAWPVPAGFAALGRRRR